MSAEIPKSLAEATWLVDLEACFGKGEKRGKAYTKDLELALRIKGGKLVAGVGRASTFNLAAHKVQAQQLQVKDKTLEALLTVTINPDRWVPKGRSPTYI